MGPERAPLVLRLVAAIDAVIGVALVLSTWDGLYTSLELPKPTPALPAQLGGVAVVALAYLIWAAAGNQALRRPVATAGFVANAGAALVILFWLLFRNENDLLIVRGGKAIAHVSLPLLGVLAALLAACALLLGLMAIARESGQTAQTP